MYEIHDQSRLHPPGCSQDGQGHNFSGLLWERVSCHLLGRAYSANQGTARSERRRTGADPVGGNPWIVPRHDLGRMDCRPLPQPICDRHCHVCLGVATVLAVVSASRLALALSLVPFGFFNGLLDVSMNSQAAVFEQRTGRSVMSSFHALFSLGGLLGTLFGAALLAANFSPLAHVLIGAIPFLVAGCLMHRGLIQEKQQDHPHGFFISFPSGKVVPLAIMALSFSSPKGQSLIGRESS